jgi:alkyl sulfatase BDS1-like metallo-beta-lactamase superfamily hydrolase
MIKQKTTLQKICLLSQTIFILASTYTFANDEKDFTLAKPASYITKKAQAALLSLLPFQDKQDFEQASRGLLAQEESVQIKDANGHIIGI